jgi:hypothetical protein
LTKWAFCVQMIFMFKNNRKSTNWWGWPVEANDG